MDANKLKVLQEIGYIIRPTCATCEHSDLSRDGWGYCNVYTYKHLKHNEEEGLAGLRLSVHQLGHCGSWVRDPYKIAALGLHAFDEFLRGVVE